jgi:hypothetical protein
MCSGKEISKLVENCGKCMNNKCGVIVFCNICGAAILTAFNFVANCRQIFTFQLTSLNIHRTADTSRDTRCFEYLKGNISLYDLCGCETWSTKLRERHRLKGALE